MKKIHRGLAADQSDFLKSYIDFNSRRRQQATSNFDKDFFKLMNNSCYGKLIEDVRKRTRVDVVNSKARANKLASRCQFKGFTILDDDITLVQSMKSKVVLDKPIACGFMVLENAKNHMSWFWYNILKNTYGDRVRLILSDTDSFIYAVFSENGYQDLYDLRQHMDLSDYEDGTPLFIYRDPAYRKVPGKMSDEKPLAVIREVIALKPKMYSVLSQVLKCVKVRNDPDHRCEEACNIGHSVTAKGVPKTAQKRITHDDYLHVLNRNSSSMIQAKTIRSFKHKLYSVDICKRGLSSYDDKKHVMDDGVSCMSYGHHRLRSE